MYEQFGLNFAKMMFPKLALYLDMGYQLYLALRGQPDAFAAEVVNTEIQIKGQRYILTFRKV